MTIYGNCGKCQKLMKIQWTTCYNDFYGDLCAKCEKKMVKARIDPWTGEPL